jgi:hypothetical protein
VLRAGYGISYIPRRTARQNFPVSQNNNFEALNGFVPAAVTMSTGFPAFRAVEFPPDGVIRNPDPRSNFGSTQSILPTGYVQSWNLAVQRALPGAFTLEAAYVGNHGVNNQTDYNVNAARIPGSGNAGRPLVAAFGRTADTTTYIGTHTYYHGLQVKFDRRFTRGLMVTTAYTWSKGLNASEDNGGLAIHFNAPINKGHMSDNRTHVFVQSYIWELPFGRGKRWAGSGPASWIAGGWQFQGVFTSMTGAWFTPSTAASFLNAPGNASRPNWVAPARYLRNVGPGQKFFDPASFVNPAQNTLGNAGRNILVGPGIVNVDASLFRTIKMKERFEWTLRFESFNTSNTPHFNNPDGSLTSARFGEVTGAEQDQRQFQFGVTLRF